MEFRILGALEVVAGDGPLPLGGTRQRAVLALLLIHAGQVVPVDRMIEELWGGEPPPSAQTTLRGYISHLRRALEPRRRLRGLDEILVTTGPGYRVRPVSEEFDRDRFEFLVDEGRASLEAGRAEEAAHALQRGLSLWRGPALADFTFEPFAQQEIARLEELRLVARELRVDADLALGRHTRIIPELEALLDAHPLRERLWAQLMTALYRSGRQAEALRAYRRLSDVLGEELGIVPGPDLQRMERAILLQEAWLDPPEMPTPAPASSGQIRPPDAPVESPQPPKDHGRSPVRVGNLAVPLTSFVGRDRELEAVASMIKGDQLVSLAGPGGCGKTRLALEVAAARRDAWPDGVWVAELAPVTDPALVPAAVADALRLVKEADRPPLETLAESLAKLRLLLVLDNCEQVLDGAAAVVEALLRNCPDIHLLATTREPLGIPGERVWRVPGLSTSVRDTVAGDWWDCDSVRLFVSRAAAVLPGFAVTEENAPVVVSLCRRLDGLPLAIELAAARLSVLSVEEIAARLEDRFRLLAGERRAESRHRTLRATVDWSYDALDDGERALFRRLCVFQGGFPIEAAEEIGAGHEVARVDVLDLLDGLVRKSLVVRQPDEGGLGRCRLLDTLREYGLGRVEEAGDHDAYRRHVHWCLALADAAAPELRGPRQRVWLQRLDIEHDNMRAALRWATEQAPLLAVRLGVRLWWFWARRGHVHEGRSWLMRSVEAAAPAGDAAAADGEWAAPRSLALGGAGYLAWLQGDFPEARRLAGEAAAAAAAGGEDGRLAAALATAVAGRIALDDGDHDKAAALDESAIDIYRTSGDGWGAAWTARHLASVAFRRGDWTGTAALVATSRAGFEELGDGWGVAGCLDLEAAVAQQRGDLARARALWEESIHRYRVLGDRTGLAISLHHLESFLSRLGEVEQAAALADESLLLDRELGSNVHVSAWLDILDQLGRESAEFT